ncbi:MAG TPA: DinB family protein, partial [Acidimicrobiales bacterium]|nr:DinB family protein [Acidimicrobiales bacterium]
MTADEVTPVPRARPAEDASEREVLTGFLDFLRATVVNKVAGLDDEAAFAAPDPPSALTPAGVVKHLTGVERFWFSIDFAGTDLSWPWTEQDPHGNFPPAPGDTLSTIVADYLRECERSRRAIEHFQLDARARGAGMTFTLRWALAHMIEETARHCGHLDLLRE